MSLNMTAHDMKSAINSIISEARLGGGAAPVPAPMGAAPMKRPTAPAPTASPSGTGKNIYCPTVRQAYYEKDATDMDILVCKYDWIAPQWSHILATKLNQLFGSICEATLDTNDPVVARYNANKAQGDRQQPAPLVFKVKFDKENEFLQAVVPALVKLLKGVSGKTPNNSAFKTAVTFKEDSCDNLLPNTKGYIQGAVNSDDEKKAQDRMVATWTDMLQNLNNPGAYNISQIRKVQVIGQPQADTDTGITAGHQYSDANKLMVYTQFKAFGITPTYVTQEFCWERYYHRQIKDKSQFAIIRKPKNNFKSKKLDRALYDKATYMVTHGRYTSWDAFKKLKLDPMQKLAVMFQANKMTPQSEWVSVKVYDVSNTEPIPGYENDTTFEDQANLLNNLEGIANSAADQKFGAVNAMPAAPMPHNFDTDDFYTIEKCVKDMALTALQTANLNVTANSKPDLYDSIVHYVYVYAKTKAPLYKRISNDRIEAFAKSAAVQIAYAFGILDASNDAKRYYNELKSSSDDARETSLKATVNLSFPLVQPMIAKINSYVMNSHKQYHQQRRDARLNNTQNPIQLPNVNVDADELLNDPNLGQAPAQAAPQPNAQPAAPAPQPAAASNDDDTLEESVCEEGGVQFTLADAYKLFGIEGDPSDDEVMMEDEVNGEVIEESFFRFLDKIELL